MIAYAVVLLGAILAVLSSVKALAAVYGTILTGLERNLTFLATGCANSCIHLALASVTACCLAGITAGLATKRLVGETLFSVEFLLSCSEGELLSAILADQNLVVVHEIPQSFCAVSGTTTIIYIIQQKNRSVKAFLNYFLNIFQEFDNFWSKFCYFCRIFTKSFVAYDTGAYTNRNIFLFYPAVQSGFPPPRSRRGRVK